MTTTHDGKQVVSAWFRLTRTIRNGSFLSRRPDFTDFDSGETVTCRAGDVPGFGETFGICISVDDPAPGHKFGRYTKFRHICVPIEHGQSVTAPTLAQVIGLPDSEIRQVLKRCIK